MDTAGASAHVTALLDNAGIAEDLPIARAADDLIEAIRQHQVVIVAGETGSGKSTQLPKICLMAGRGAHGLIGHTQPRRVAARSVAERVASELGSKIGDGVGYTVRFNDQVSSRTVIQVMTDGILLNEIQRDPHLSRYDTLLIDEAHERSLNIDFILGYLRQLLPQRPELRVIITSATIDTERFAEHFAGFVTEDDLAPEPAPAPVFVVEGRTYPVEVRYRPFGPDHDPADRRDQVAAVIDAIDELLDAIDGDILVFLSGEREIRDTAQAISERFQPRSEQIDVLPLYARLSAHEQHRIFEPHRGRRVVLATNIAETSITVPGVRSVIDTGTARISRYSKRLKVQRLPIEPISQASANQRSGRCGRVGPGVAIRLYGEDDFAERPEFTDPEILRTNLASVILQMTAIGLGDVSRFPFVEPPDNAQINDGYRLLDELGALKPGAIGAPRRLTATGKKLARLPVDPRLGRMLIEAGRLGCVREVLVIASALSIQDVRERPDDQPERAAEMHNRFRVPGSDLLSIVSLWDYLQEQQRQRSSGSFRRMCHTEFLHYLRVREWRDLYSQLRQVAGRLQLRAQRTDAHPDHVHRAVLSGLLSHIGERDDVRNSAQPPPGRARRGRPGRRPDGVEFRGARDSRFAIARGSVLARRPPEWVMAAELMETNRLWARMVAEIDPAWCEPLASHLVKRSYGDAYWQLDKGRAATNETVTLYGRSIVAGRVTALDRVDPTLARELFIRHVLVAGEWPDGRPPDSPVGDFVAHNERYLNRVRLLEARVRRGDLVSDHQVYEFFDRRVPKDVTDVRTFELWWTERRPVEPASLDFNTTILSNRDGIDLDGVPGRWRFGDATYPVTYRFEPGAALDGASVIVPVATLGQFNPSGLDWLVPGYRPELIDEFLRQLPKEIRRGLAPMNDTSQAVQAHLSSRYPQIHRVGPTEEGGSSPSRPAEPVPRFTDALAEALHAVRDVSVRPALFRPETLPTWLRTHLVIVGPDGDVLDAGDDWDAIVARQQGAARAAVAKLSDHDEQRGLTDWTFGEIPQVIERNTTTGAVGSDATIRAYPTLVDAGPSVTLRVVDNTELAERALRGGVHRLLALNVAPRLDRVRSTLSNRAQLAIAAAEFDIDELAGDAIAAAVDAIADRYSVPRTEEGYRVIEQAVRAEGLQLAADALAEAADILACAGRVHTQVMEMRAGALEPTRTDVIAHRDRLVAPGFIRRSGTDRLPDVHRYLRGTEYRIAHLDGDIMRDRRRMDQVHPVERAVAAGIAQHAAALPAVRQLAWRVEEYRLSVFATSVGVDGPVSPQRISSAYQQLTGAPLQLS